MATETKKQRAQRRAKDAKKLADGLKRLFDRSFDIPSFTGKSKFIDRITPLMRKAELLAHNLEVEVDTSEEK